MKSVILGSILLLVFGVVLFVAIPNGIWIPSRLPDGAISPAAWPRVVTIGLMFLGAVLIVQGLKQRKVSPAPTPVPPAADDLPGPVARLKIVAAVALLALYAWGLHVIGIVLSSALAFFLFALLYGERRLTILLPVAVLLPVGLYYFFTQVAHIPMPTGIFG